MAEFDNKNRGVLFRDEKRTNEKAPEYTGTINVDGVEKRIAAWIKVSKTGKKFFSINVSDIKPKTQDAPPQQAEDDSVPF